jgi:glycerol kinase
MMQFQADVIGVPVERPEIVETTALGAAGLAGIAAGVWRDSEEFVSVRRFTTFTPAIGDSERSKLISGWNRAVGAALHWARHTEKK